MAIALGWVLVVALCTVASLYVQLQTVPGRRAALVLVQETISKSLRGRIEAGSIETLTARTIRLRDVRILDEQGNVVLAVDSLRFRIDPFAIRPTSVVIDTVIAHGVDLSLRRTPSGELALSDALASRLPSDPTGEPMALRLDRIDLRDVTVRDLPNVAPDVVLRHGHVLGSLRIEDDLTLAVEALRADLMRRDRQLLRVETGRPSVLALGRGERSELDLALTGARDRVVLRAEARMGAEQRPDRFDAVLSFAPLTDDVLPDLGLSELARDITTQVVGAIRVHGRMEDASLDGALVTRGGPLSLRGRVRDLDRLFAEAWTPGLEVGRLHAAAPDMKVSGRIELRTRIETEDGTRPLIVATEELVVADNAVPDLRLTGRVHRDRLELRDLDVPELTSDAPGARIDLTGTVGFEGDADVRVAARLPRIRGMRGFRSLRGSLEADARVRSRPGGGAISVDGRVHARLRNLRVDDIAARQLNVDAAVSGPIETPRLDATVTAERARVAGLAITRARVTAGGGPRVYRAHADVRLEPRRTVTADVVARNAGPGAFDVDVDATAGGVLRTPIELHARRIAIRPGGRIAFPAVEIESGASHASIAGRVRGEQVDVRMSESRLDLAPIVAAAGLSVPVEGTLVVDEAWVRGTIARPVGALRATLVRGRVRGIEIRRVELVAALDAPRRHAEATADIELTEGSGEVRWLAHFPRGPFLRAVASPRTYHEAEVVAEDLPLGLVAAVAPEAPPLSGQLTAEIKAAGPIEQLDVVVDGRVHALQTEGLDEPVEVVVHAMGGRERLRAEVEAADESGRLATVVLGAEAGAMDIARAPREVLLRVPWELDARIPRRLLTEIPVVRDQLPWLVGDVSARLVATHHPPQGLDATLVGGIDMAPETIGGLGCEPHALRASVDLRLTGGRALEGTARLDGVQVLAVDVRSPETLRETLGRTPPAIPPLDGSIEVARLPLEDVPYACAQLAGRIDAALNFRGLFGDAPAINLRAAGSDVRIQGSEALGMTMNARAAEGRAGGSLVVVHEGSERIRARAELPLRFERGEIAPVLEDDFRWEASARFADAPLRAMLSPIRSIERVEGTLDGHVRATGRGTTRVAARGALAIDNGAVTLLDPLQRLEDIHGRVQFTEERIQIHRLHFGDLGGDVTIDGGITLRDGIPDEALLDIRADDMPLRQDGTVAAYATARIDVRADLLSRDSRGNIVFRSLELELPDEMPHAVQSLDAHPNVRYVDAAAREARAERREEAREEAAEEREEDREAAAAPLEQMPPPPPVVVRIDASRPFWIRRRDFSVQLSARLRVVVEEPPGQPAYARVTGRVEVRRGFVELLGRSFRLQRGEIVFTGGRDIDPQLDLTAVHQVSGEDVELHIRGHLTEPELSFTTSSGDATMGEALGLLTDGRGGNADVEAGQQAASFLTGLTAGLLTMGARRRLGGVAPVIVLETGERVGTGRIRLGFELDRIIPESMQDRIVGAYVEGYVGADDRTGDSTERSTTGGVLLEFLFRRDVVWGTSFEPPSSWGMEWTWEP